MTDLQKILETLVDAPDSFMGKIPAVEQGIYRAVLSLVKKLETDSTGKVVPTIENIKKVISIQSELKKIVVSKDYVNAVTDFAKAFNEIAGLQNRYFAAMGADSKLSKTLTDLSISNTVEALAGNGYSETIISGIKDLLLKSVTSGGHFDDLVEGLRTKLLSSEQDGKSLVAKYAQTYTQDALSVFSAEHTKLITADIGLEWFRYTGSLKTTSREFCKHLVEKEYVHVSELPDIVKGHIDGHSCKLGSNGLPEGMFDDTTPQNFQVNRGGWNCGHQLVPVSAAVVPQNLKVKFS